jgi:hypothetical protein
MASYLTAVNTDLPLCVFSRLARQDTTECLAISGSAADQQRTQPMQANGGTDASGDSSA